MIGPDGTVGNGELRVNISDGNRFLGFLGSLTPETARETGATHSLARLSDILSQQVLDGYDLNDPSNEALELLGRLGRISDEYRRLGVEGKGVERFETYLAHSRARDLREYIAIEQQGLMQEPGQFGPADWQQDATVEFLQRKWSGALTTLDMARQNPHSGALYESLSAHLRKCVAVAQEFLASHPDYYAPAAMAEMAATLEQARQHLA